MLKKIKFNLKTSFSVLFGFQLVLIISLAILIILLYQNQINLAKSRDNSFNSYLLADQLRQSSDDLTRMVRTYVATGNPEFEREYWAVLDIRNGKVPRPLDYYDNIYWDFVSATGQKQRGDGEAVPLRELMAKEGFTADELAKLDLAQKNSDGLVRAETVAMYAMKGLFEDSQGNFTIKKAPDQKLASDLVNNEAYHQTKAEIMKPIDEFYVMIEIRTSAAVAKYLGYANTLFAIIILLSIFILIMFILSFIVVWRQISLREKSEKQLVDLNKNLDKEIKLRTNKLARSEEILKNSVADLEKLNKFMTGREIKMIELKKELQELKDK